MTAMPQLVSLFNAVGGGAAALSPSTTTSACRPAGRRSASRRRIPTILDVIIGSVTFSGSVIAAGKLQGLIARPAHHPARAPGS